MQAVCRARVGKHLWDLHWDFIPSTVALASISYLRHISLLPLPRHRYLLCSHLLSLMVCWQCVFSSLAHTPRSRTARNCFIIWKLPEYSQWQLHHRSLSTAVRGWAFPTPGLMKGSLASSSSSVLAFPPFISLSLRFPQTQFPSCVCHLLRLCPVSVGAVVMCGEGDCFSTL